MNPSNDRTIDPEVSIRRIDFADGSHVAALLALLDEYASGPTGRGYGLDDRVKSRLPAVLAARAYFVGWLAFVDGQAAGVVNCFEGVSTFRAEPLLNIHDIAVTARFQRRGVGRALLGAVEEEARVRGCCKITLEVLDGNEAAVRAYLAAGFEPFELDPAMGAARFFERKLY